MTINWLLLSKVYFEMLTRHWIFIIANLTNDVYFFIQNVALTWWTGWFFNRFWFDTRRSSRPLLQILLPTASIQLSGRIQREAHNVICIHFLFLCPVHHHLFIYPDPENKEGNENTPFSLFFFFFIQVLSSWLKFIFMLICSTSFRLCLTWEMGARLELMTLHRR